MIPPIVMEVTIVVMGAVLKQLESLTICPVSPIEHVPVAKVEAIINKDPLMGVTLDGNSSSIYPPT